MLKHFEGTRVLAMHYAGQLELTSNEDGHILKCTARGCKFYRIPILVFETQRQVDIHADSHRYDVCHRAPTPAPTTCAPRQQQTANFRTPSRGEPPMSGHYIHVDLESAQDVSDFEDLTELFHTPRRLLRNPPGHGRPTGQDGRRSLHRQAPRLLSAEYGSSDS